MTKACNKIIIKMLNLRKKKKRIPRLFLMDTVETKLDMREMACKIYTNLDTHFRPTIF